MFSPVEVLAMLAVWALSTAHSGMNILVLGSLFTALIVIFGQCLVMVEYALGYDLSRIHQLPWLAVSTRGGGRK